MGTKLGNLGGRAYLVGLLREKQGLSRRQSVAVVNVILEAMIAALRRSRRVEFPFGSLQRVRRYFRGYEHDDWPASQDGYTVEYALDRSGDRELDGLPPLPERRRRPKPEAAGSGK